MAVHLLRDYQNQNFSSATGTPDQIPWLLAIFCRRVLQYTHVGNTNFDLDSATYLKASGEASPNRAGINFGVNNRYEVSIPIAVRAVTTADIGRMLVLRSVANPRFNSGIFLITGVNTVDNRYIIDYRSSDSPPAEVADTMPWWLYEKDSTFPNNRTTANAGTGYRSYGAASTCSRVILQSPHATGWQVRICYEHELDWRGTFVAGGSLVCNIWTPAPGFGGNSIGDFAPGGEHVHSPLWWDSNDINRCGQQPAVGQVAGFAVLGVQEQYRIYMAGDDEGHGVYCAIRRPFGPVPFGTTYCHWQFQFGLPENEPSPLPVRPARRLFVMGNSSNTNSSQVYIVCGANSFHYHGLTQGFNGQPVTCNLASWSKVETNTAISFGTSGAPVFDPNGGDNPYTNATDLLPVDLVAGMGENWYNTSNLRVHQFEPRIMGTLPFVRTGRSSLPFFSLTTDPSNSWIHLPYGTYMVWGGPAVIP